MQILDLIPIGKKNAVTREQLMEITGQSDRKNRQMIENARAEGEIICNDQDGKGYYLPETLEEVYRAYKQGHSRAMSILKQQKTMRKVLKDAGYEI